MTRKLPAIDLHHGDMRAVLRKLIDDGVRVHSIVTDPPYHLTSTVERFGSPNAAPARAGKTGAYARASAGFMGQKWDGGDIAFQAETWRLCYDLLPPGGHLLAFSGTRTYHRMAYAIERAGFEIRDMIAWTYGTGFPKSHGVAKGIDRAAGVKREVVGKYKRGPAMHPGNEGADNWRDNHTGEVEITVPATDAARQWEGWGTALKPALEPICVARKPLSATVARNMLVHGVGALNIDACRVEGAYRPPGNVNPTKTSGGNGIYGVDDRNSRQSEFEPNASGRWPANIVHDGSAEVEAAFPASKARNGGVTTGRRDSQYGMGAAETPTYRDDGSAARFFYSAKASKDDRAGTKHPTVKPVSLKRWLVRLVTPPGGIVLDPFAGTGTTGAACFREGFGCILVEREAEYVADIKRRFAALKREKSSTEGK
jgi:DNA modification methylase